MPKKNPGDCLEVDLGLGSDSVRGMEPPVVKKRGRPRKRRREDDEKNADDGKSGVETKKQVIETRPIALLGRYMLKDFEGNGAFLGKVVYYADGLYRVSYEDGDFEDLESREIRENLLEDSDFDGNLSFRRKKLDELILKSRVTHSVKSTKEAGRVEASTSIELPGGAVTENDEGEVDDDSSSDSSEYAKDRDLSFEVEALVVPPPELPPSSGTIGVPEQYVSHLFSVYDFLRSFSICLFLCPFTLDDFVGSLNCRVPNTLLDAIHVAVMRPLRRHLETLSEEGLELASKCWRCTDWSLLDTLTWPVYVVQYLTIMGYTKGPEWKGFYEEVLGREYYSLSAGRKLLILQVLCDDVLDSVELRTEIDMREESEVGIDSDAEAVNPPENGPRRVHPRYSKTSACKDREAIGIIGTTHMINTPSYLNCRGPKGTKGELDTVDMDVDRNSDECRLCGMDGTLLCCDGCPSAYHTRCIGVMKMSIPEGSWYCPECTINKLGPTIAIGTSLKGAEIFGIDSYGQIFLGTCNYLLVLKASVIAEPCIRYYNREDIPKVLQVLCSSEQHVSMYLGVCQALLQYWDIPSSIFSLPEMTKRDTKFGKLKKDANCPSSTIPPSIKDNHSDTASANESTVDNMTASLETSIDVVQVDFPSSQINHDTKQLEHPVNIMKHPVNIMKLCEGNVSTPSVSQHADPSDITSQSLVERSFNTYYSSVNINCSYTGHANGSNCLVNLSSQRKEGNAVVLGKGENNSFSHCVYMGSLYKPQAYINHYMHGEFAASAAAKLAALSSEETRLSEGHASDNTKKAPSENYLQAKAFSLTASRFFWPTSEKKLVEVPRERCGWCLSCKASVASKRGCMLNHAALCATKGAMKILASLRPIKSGEGSLASIATYILYMEENLCGLILGPFLNANFRNQWRKQVEQASTCSEIKVLLLQLEENIRIIALSSDWVKLVDDWLVEYSTMQNAMCTAGATQKRGPSGRRNKKQSAISELTTDGGHEKGFVWWHGGKRSKLVFQKAILPRLMVKRAARHGGLRKISGICYTDGPEIPKRSRQSIWRAAVEMSNNASQLALQVRCLDLHVRWNDLVHPEQNLLDGKSVETEASAFRNAIICSKKVGGSKVTYGVAFGGQKHLPSRVMKNIIEREQCEDGNDKFWFSENRVPLYLIKEYEASATELPLPSIQEPFNFFTKLQKKRLQAPHRDIFFYLTCKRDNLEICTCISCQRDVVLQTAAKCSVCKGSCHSDCTITSAFSTNEDVDFFTMCKQCHGKALAQNASCNESPTSPLQLPEYQNLTTATKGSRSNLLTTATRGSRSSLLMTASKGSKSNLRAQGTCSETKKAASQSSSAAKSRHKKCSWGIIWKKKSKDGSADATSAATVDASAGFRLNNILLRGGLRVHRMQPQCKICHKPYRPDLMYICCETCKNWYHADAVELEESKIFDVAGFKCCKCRRIKAPACPFAVPKDETLEGKRTGVRPLKQENSDSRTTLFPKQSEATTPMLQSEKIRIRPLKQESSGVDSDSGTINSVQSEPSTPMVPLEEMRQQDDDPLLLPLTSVQLITEPNSEIDTEWDAGKPGPQKLPVRRHVKHEGDMDSYPGGNFPDVEVYTHFQMEDPLEATAGTFYPPTEWNASVESIEGEVMFDDEGLDYENLDYEPQTLFTFSELLGVDASGDEPEDQGKYFGTISQDMVSEQDRVSALNDESEPILSLNPSVECKSCLQADPEPDLSCQNCGLWIHSHCLPSNEPTYWDGGWKCSFCQEWR
ncbi:Autoimmune regulator [Parasponia andersonii]|uniref:Autoimmune regulator n=1 Tax=Parasponia andersonii TaxID=3476 RepID=A0A2P5BX90_PARAD|nr:Autoimmune regulator [Parasponia andersonii]